MRVHFNLDIHVHYITDTRTYQVRFFKSLENSTFDQLLCK